MIPSEKYACSGSPDKLQKGSTATLGLPSSSTSSGETPGTSDRQTVSPTTMSNAPMIAKSISNLSLKNR